ncbi:NUDIX domain-containing protein [Caviibacter abscessus]|uniref:NUDIX domain-containing protein n=1 Tax=Caviibacter abscessus TaxID=1766719 RepID=UPI0008361F80|nr:NUDIX domain-containing protein [Caviibacter abscessus]
MKIILDNSTIKIFEILKQYGRAYIVGGFVRDKYLNVTTNDIDFVANIELNVLVNILREYNPVILNNKYQIIHFKHDGKKYEIARLREDIGILDGRNPEYIKFVDDIEIDAIRRDFTINSIYYDGNNTHDFLNGKDDIKDGIIKVIGNAEKRLKEDKIRILRAFRFMAKYDFKMDKNLEEAISKLSKDKRLFIKFSKDRLNLELTKIISSQFSYKAIKKMYELNILKFFIPEIDVNFDKHLFNKIYKILEKHKYINKELYYATLFAHIGRNKFNQNQRLIRSLKGYESYSISYFEKFSKKVYFTQTEIDNIKNLIYYHTIIFKNPSLMMLKRMTRDLKTNKNICKLLNYIKSMYELNNEDKEYISSLVNKILNNIQSLYLKDEVIFFSDLEIGNVDLYNLGIDKNLFNKIKEKIYSEVVNGKIPNSKDDIIRYIYKILKIKKELIIEKCAGAVVYRKTDKGFEFLIARGLNGGNWGFPKGHIEENEYEYATAIREVKEETNIDIDILYQSKFRHTIKYAINENTLKEVVLFIGHSKTQDIKVDEQEIGIALWLDYKNVLNTLTYSHQRTILKQAMVCIY